MREKMRILKKTLILALVGAMMLLMISCKKEITAPEGYKLASNLEHVDYMMFVPSDWEIKDSGTMTSAYVSENDKTSVSVIQRNKLQNEEASIQWWYDNYYISELKKSIDESKIVEKKTEDFELDGVQAKKFYLDVEMGGEVYSYIVVGAYTNASYYCITYTSKGGLFDKNLEAFNGILNEFRFEK